MNTSKKNSEEKRSKKKAKRSVSPKRKEETDEEEFDESPPQAQGNLPTDLTAEFDSFDGFNPNLEWGQSEIKMEESRPFWNSLDDMLTFQQPITLGFPLPSTSFGNSSSAVSPQSSSPIPALGQQQPQQNSSTLQMMQNSQVSIRGSHDLSEESPPSSPVLTQSNLSTPMLANLAPSTPMFFQSPNFSTQQMGIRGAPTMLNLAQFQSSSTGGLPPLPSGQQQLIPSHLNPNATVFQTSTSPGGQTPNEALNQRPSAKIIQEVQKLIPQIASRLENMSWTQKQLTMPFRREVVSALDKEQKEMKNLIEIADKQLNALIDSVFLEPIEMHQVLQLQQELFFHLKQLELYNIELQGIQKDNFIPSMALVIISQPFPESVKQKKKIDEPGVTVRLLTGARYNDPKPNALVKAEIINFNTSTNKAKKSTLTLENCEKVLNEHGIARFTDLNFPNGTRLKSVRLKFTARVDIMDTLGQVHPTIIESNPSNPIVVKTNENQWYEAEGILLQKAAFGNALEITWQRLANWLQRRYLMATRQSLQNPSRPLSQHDLNYLHRLKFSTAPRITQKDFEKFWEWCGPLFHKIRYQRHLCSLWTSGYICGFLTREEVETVLKSQAVGTFLIRFSDRMPKFVVSYQSAEGSYNQTKVKHYLVKSDDTHGAKKTLPDFLNAYRELLCILQIWTDPVTTKRILRRCDKDTALKDFYSSKKEGGANGYEEDINISY